MKEPRKYLAFYWIYGEWRLITREVSTLSHANKMQKKYESSYRTQIINIGDTDGERIFIPKSTKED